MWKNILFVIVLAIGLDVWLSSPGPKTLDKTPAVVMETLNPQLLEFEPMWKAEIGRRFNHAVGILVHGGDLVEGQWIIGSSTQQWKHVMPVQEAVHHFMGLYPGRTVVLLACNTGHLRLGIPGVYYAHSSVWCVPDRAVTPEMMTNKIVRQTLTDPTHFIFKPIAGEGSRWSSDPDVVGNIFEFTCE